MPLRQRISNLGVNTETDAIAALLNNGFLRIYDSVQAATADTAVGAQVLLAELRFNATAFAAAVAGVAAANALTDDSSANATGTATWFRALKSDGSTVVFDGSIGTGGNKTITAGSQANPGVLTKATHGLVTGDIITITGFTGNWAPANGTWPIDRVDANSFSIPVDTSGFGAMAGSPVYVDANINLNSNAIQINAAVSVSGFNFTSAKGV